jgi:hypothetical protein
VLYLIWHDPWMTVARDTYLSRMLARIGWLTLPAVEGGTAGAGRYPPLAGDEPWLASVERVLLSSEPFAFEAATSPRRRRSARVPRSCGSTASCSAGTAPAPWPAWPTCGRWATTIPPERA